MRTCIYGAGAMGTVLGAFMSRAGMQVVMCDLAVPTSIRRTVCFSEAIRLGEARVDRLAVDVELLGNVAAHAVGAFV